MPIIQVIAENNICFLENGRFKSDPRPLTPAAEAAIRASKKHPKLTGRLWKAIEIVETEGALWELTGADQIPREHRDRIVRATHQCRSLSDGESVYTISRIDWKHPDLAAPRPDHRHVYSCNCPDYSGRYVQVVDGQPACKHIIAVRLSAYMVRLASEAIKQPMATVVITTPDEDHDPTGQLILSEATRKARGIARWQLRQRLEQQLDAANHQLMQAAGGGG